MRCDVEPSGYYAFKGREHNAVLIHFLNIPQRAVSTRQLIFLESNRIVLANGS